MLFSQWINNVVLYLVVVLDYTTTTDPHFFPELLNPTVVLSSTSIALWLWASHMYHRGIQHMGNASIIIIIIIRRKIWILGKSTRYQQLVERAGHT